MIRIVPIYNYGLAKFFAKKKPQNKTIYSSYSSSSYAIVQIAIRSIAIIRSFNLLAWYSFSFSTLLQGFLLHTHNPPSHSLSLH